MMNAWFWGAVALILVAAETVLPGVYLFWLGLAAGVVALTMLMSPEMSVLSQLVVFGASAFLAVIAYSKWGRKIERTPEHEVNNPATRFIGQVYTLISPLENGTGRVQIADAFWTVNAKTTAPSGSKVKVVGFNNGNLDVEVVSF
jgi:inner membrane protein